MSLSSYQTVVYLTDLSVPVEHKKYSEFVMILQDLNVRKKCHVMLCYRKVSLVVTQILLHPKKPYVQE